MRRLFTKPRQVSTSVRITQRDRELLFAAARLERISQSEFVRAAIRAHSERVLATAGQEASR